MHCLAVWLSVLAYKHDCRIFKSPFFSFSRRTKLSAHSVFPCSACLSAWQQQGCFVAVSHSQRLSLLIRLWSKERELRRGLPGWREFLFTENPVAGATLTGQQARKKKTAQPVGVYYLLFPPVNASEKGQKETTVERQ